MITENQLNEAIAEMQGQRHPNADTCIKLASYYTIKNELFPAEKAEPEPRMIETRYSSSGPGYDMIGYSSDTDFGRSVSGRSSYDVIERLDKIMSALYVIDKPLYDRVLRDLNE